jgi:MFS family permease
MRERAIGPSSTGPAPCRSVLLLLTPKAPVRNADMTGQACPSSFYGWRVVSAAFVLAVFGWGVGFYGPPVYLHAIREARDWQLSLVSTAVTVHFLVGAIAVANLPVLYRRYGLPSVTTIGAFALALGIFGWASATAPWQLFAATLLSGVGWAAMSGAAVNAIVSPWFVRTRPAALAMAYNGASIGGVVFSPLWVAAIGALGFQVAAAAIGVIMAITIADRVFSRTPEQMGLTPDGDAPGAPAAFVTLPSAQPLLGRLLWRDLKFITLSAGMALGLFAQIGLIAHLFSLLVSALGAQQAGLWRWGSRPPAPLRGARSSAG